MRSEMKTLVAVTMVGAGLLAASALQASPAQKDMDERQHAEGMMPGEGTSGMQGMMSKEGMSGMHGMMQQMGQMMESCNKMMDSHSRHDEGATQPREPAG